MGLLPGSSSRTGVAVVLGGLALLAAGIAGCGDTAGYTASGNRTDGKELFTSACGGCHVLADAGTRGQVGPNLDDAFRRALADGMTESTVAQVVRGQIQYPVTEPPTGSPGMPGIDETLPECSAENEPKGCVADQDRAADDIAVYVAAVASKAPTGGGEQGGGEQGGGGTPTGQEGAQVFASAGCGSCHTLAAAGSTGTVGPNLDDAKPSKELAVDRVTNGRGAMPSFKGQLNDAEIDAVAQYVSTVAGK